VANFGEIVGFEIPAIVTKLNIKKKNKNKNKEKVKENVTILRMIVITVGLVVGIYRQAHCAYKNE
jgi:hypothetical protein